MDSRDSIWNYDGATNEWYKYNKYKIIKQIRD